MDRLAQKLAALEEGACAVGSYGNGEMVAAVRIGSRTQHPLRDGVQEAAGKTRDFVLLFGVDENLEVAVRNEVKSEEVIGQLERMMEFSVIEPVNEDVVESNMVWIASAADSSQVSELRKGGGLDEVPLDLLEDLTARFRIAAQNMLPFGTMEKSKALLAKIFSELSQPENSGISCPILVATNSGGYIGQVFDEETDSYTVFSFNPAFMEGAFNLEDLTRQFVQFGSSVASSKIKACYDLLGSASESGSCVSLVVEWKLQRSSQSRLLGPPALIPERSVLVVRGSSFVMDASNWEMQRNSFEPASDFGEETVLTGSIAPDRPLQMMELLCSFTATSQFSLSSYSVDNAWKTYVKEFLRSATTGTLFSRSPRNQDRTSRSESGDFDFETNDFGIKEDEYSSGNSLFASRSDLDFTEHFWEKVVVRADSLQQILFGLHSLVGALKGGELLPYIHKSNQSLLGSLCKQAILSHMSEKSSSKEGSATLEKYLEIFEKGEFPPSVQTAIADNVAQLGAWKMKRDLVHWYNQVGVEEQFLQGYLPAVKRIKDDPATVLDGLVQLRNALQLTWTALRFRCPRLQVRELALAYLRGSQNLSAGRKEERTFLLPIRSQLPWVRDDAAGITSLPTPKFWQVTQGDDNRKTLQTTRLSPYGKFNLATDPVREEAARRFVEMLSGNDPRSLAHRYISREYESLREQNPSQHSFGKDMAVSLLFSRTVSLKM